MSEHKTQILPRTETSTPKRTAAGATTGVPRAGDIVDGKYRLERILGRGAIGAVWEAEHLALEQQIAIKFIEATHLGNVDIRRRFFNEARAAAKIESNHAIRIFDYGVTKSRTPYIVMERLHGESLEARLRRVGRLSLEETARIVRHVSRALSRAHAFGIVHRDLKPENVFLVESGEQGEIAKVLDFGVAKLLSSSEEQTAAGTMIGTPDHMSPEQFACSATVDHRCDLWAVGVMAFRCATGVSPFDGAGLVEIVHRVVTAPIPVPSSFNPALPSAFDAWMTRALGREVEDRFQSAAELADALRAAGGVDAPAPSKNPPSTDVPASAPPEARHASSGESVAVDAGLERTAASEPKIIAKTRGVPTIAWVMLVVGLLVGAFSALVLSHYAGAHDAGAKHP